MVVVVTVGPEGKASTVNALSGHPLLKKVAELAALQSTFDPSEQKCSRVSIVTFTFLIGPPEADQPVINGPFHMQIFAKERKVREHVAGKNPCSDLRFQAVGGEAPTMSIKDALEFPKCVEDKLIRLYGIYSAGFEGSVYGDPSNKESAWVEFSPYYSITKKCSRPKALDVLKSPSGGTFGLVAYGILKTGGEFGHMNAWDNEFQVMCVDEMKQFSDVTVLFEYQKPAVQKQILNWYDQKH